MTTIREAAQQAMEALEGWDNYGKWVWPESALEQAKRNTTEALAALKAALAEPVQEPDSPERRCGGPGCDMRCCQPVAQRGAMFHTHPAVERQRSVEAAVRPACGVDPAAKAEPVQEPQGCDHCNHPLYAAIKCRVCGRMTHPPQDHFPDATKMVQEPVPVATMTVREDMGADFKFHRPHTLQPGQQFYLYTAPPQRRPLTEDEIRQVGASYTEETWIDDGWSIAFARAIEHAHGITGDCK